MTRRDSPFGPDDRAVSDTIGFVLIISVVLLSLVSVFTVGVESLQDARDFEEFNNVERAYDVFAQNMDDIMLRSAPSRSTEIRITEGDIETGNRTNVTVEILDSGGSTVHTYRYRTNPVVYSQGSRSIRYDAGAVVRARETGSMLVEPEFFFGSDQIIIEVVQTQPSARSFNNPGTVLVRANFESRGINHNQSKAVAISIEPDTAAQADAWERYFVRVSEDTGVGSVSRSGTNVTYTYDEVVADIYVRRTTVGIELRR